MQQRARMYAAVLMQQHMARFGDRVTGGSIRQALLEAARGLVEERPRVLFTDGGVERLQDLLQCDAVGGVQREVRAAAAHALLAHHRA